jgi:alpha-1,3/alpha-1,6-mannosyltransferase
MPRTLLKKFHIVFATLRNLWLVAMLCLSGEHFDAMFVDQVSAGVPLLKLFGYPVLFYCHFPDKLLSIRTSWIKSLYRLPMDILEQTTTCMFYVDKS